MIRAYGKGLILINFSGKYQHLDKLSHNIIFYICTLLHFFVEIYFFSRTQNLVTFKKFKGESVS